MNIAYKSDTSATTKSSKVNTNSTPACAVCKYQRRKCAANCFLAPYFPADNQKDFLNAHKLFGVSNITKILKNVKPIERKITMDSIIFQGNVREKDPVGGCFRIIEELRQQINYHKAELHLVLRQLAFYQSQSMRNFQISEAINIDRLVDYDPLKDPQDSSVYDRVTIMKEEMPESLHVMPTLADESVETNPLICSSDNGSESGTSQSREWTKTEAG